MAKNFVRFITISLLFLLTISFNVYADGKKAIEDAAKSGKFLFLVFYRDKDTALGSMEKTISGFLGKSEKPAVIYKLSVDDAKENELVQKYINNAPMPFLLIFAPNGAIPGGFAQTVTSDQIRQCLNTSELVLKILKPLQEQKVVLVSLQNSKTKFNIESMTAVKNFASDPQYKDFVGVIDADPGASTNQDFIKLCGLKEKIVDATVIILLPPNKVAKILSGKITKDDISKALQSCTAGSGCCSDRRFKENITPIDSALEKVLQLQGVSFTWKYYAFPEWNFPTDREIGLIAQDVEPVIPEAVHTDPEGYKSISYDKLVAVLIEAIKEMKLELNEQDALIQELEARIKELETEK